MKIDGVLEAIKKGGLIPYSKSIYRKKKKEITKKLLENSKILMIDLNLKPDEINRKLSKAREEFVAFYDTDAVFAEDYFKELRDELKKNPDTGYATGRLIARNGEPVNHFGSISKEIYRYDVKKEVMGGPLLIGTLCRTYVITLDSMKIWLIARRSYLPQNIWKSHLRG